MEPPTEMKETTSLVFQSTLASSRHKKGEDTFNDVVQLRAVFAVKLVVAVG